MVLRHGIAGARAAWRFAHSRSTRRVVRGPGFSREHSAHRGHRSARCGAHGPTRSARWHHVARTEDPTAGGAVMPAPRRRITAAERDRALRLRGKLTASFGVMGTAAVAALAVAAYHTDAGTSTTSTV